MKTKPGSRSEGPRRERVSVADLARACGVSAMTVSRALRGQGRVAESTRKRVLQAAQEMGYRLNVKRGRPRRKEDVVRGTVDLVFQTGVALENLYASHLMAAIERELARRGHDCVVRICDEGYERFLSLCEALRRSGSAGILLVGAYAPERAAVLNDIARRVVLVDSVVSIPGSGGVACVAFDNLEAVRMALRHLRERGRKRVLLIKGTAGHYFSREIELGYREFHQGEGTRADEDLIAEADFTADGARELIASRLAGGLDFDAVFTNDEMATGVLQALHRAGRRVPEDVAVVGCDGLPIGRQTIPPLTTVALDYRQLGTMAVARLFSEGDASGGGCRVRLLPELVVREST